MVAALLWALALGPPALVGAATARDGVAPGHRPVPGRLLEPFRAPAHRYAPGHRGVDLAAAPGEVVRAARPGTVTFAGSVAGVGWVTVDHSGGLSTTYGGVEPVAGEGEPVVAGEVVARLAVGATHLDWGARWTRSGSRTYLDPLLLLVDLRPVLVAAPAG